MSVLSHAIVSAERVGDGHWTVVFLHGILGSGSNWRTFARRLVSEKPAWRAILVDLRKHGASQDFAPPHTLAACVSDLLALEQSIGRFDAIIGHSFGGKVALEYAQARRELPVCWVLDSALGAHPDRRANVPLESAAAGSLVTSDQIIAMLSSVPERFETREAFIQYVEEHGAARSIAMWLAMNVRQTPEGDGYVMRVDLPAMRSLIDDYFLRDEWAYLEDSSRTTRVHLVVGGRSETLDAGERALANRVAEASPDRTWVHVIANAGHWVHVDAPDELLALVKSYF